MAKVFEKELATFSTPISKGGAFFCTSFSVFGKVLETCHHLMLNPSWDAQI
jgi:hypothetical protein